jgi:glutamate dehydrogenase
MDMNDEERGEEALIAAAAKLASSAATPVDFVTGLFAHAAPEDLLRYDPAQLAALAEGAWSLPSMPKTRHLEYSLRGPVRVLRGASAQRLRARDRQRRYAVSSRFGSGELSDRGLSVRFVVHPIFSVRRDENGRLIAFHGTNAAPDAMSESFIHIHLDPLHEAPRRAEIAASLERVLADVRRCVADWPAMLSRVGEAIANLQTRPPPSSPDEIAEAIAFLEWLVNGNFHISRSSRLPGDG